MLQQLHFHATIHAVDRGHQMSLGLKKAPFCAAKESTLPWALLSFALWTCWSLVVGAAHVCVTQEGILLCARREHFALGSAEPLSDFDMLAPVLSGSRCLWDSTEDASVLQRK